MAFTLCSRPRPRPAWGTAVGGSSPAVGTTGPASPLRTALIAITYTGGGLLSLAWYIMVGLRLWKLGR